MVSNHTENEPRNTHIKKYNYKMSIRKYHTFISEDHKKLSG